MQKNLFPQKLNHYPALFLYRNFFYIFTYIYNNINIYFYIYIGDGRQRSSTVVNGRHGRQRSLIQFAIIGTVL